MCNVNILNLNKQSETFNAAKSNLQVIKKKNMNVIKILKNCKNLHIKLYLLCFRKKRKLCEIFICECVRSLCKILLCCCFSFFKCV